MSDIGKGLRTLMLTKTAITDLVGQRITPGVLDANPDLPAITYRVTSYIQSKHLSGVNAHAEAFIQFNIYAATYLTAQSVLNAVRHALQNHSGAAGAETVQSCFLSGGGAIETDRPVDGGQLDRHGYFQDYRVHFVETTS